MFYKWIEFINNRKLILASGSPRRKEILKDLGLNFDVIKSEFKENLAKETMDPSTYVKATCENKFSNFLMNCVKAENKIEINFLVTADTIVEFKGKIIEKPKSKEECKEWFLEYSKNEVLVHTYMVIGIINEKYESINKESFITTTKVYFDNLTEEGIEYYLNTNDYMDKAGGFGIQGKAKSLIKGIEGDYFNVVGLPVNNFCNHFQKLLEENYEK